MYSRFSSQQAYFGFAWSRAHINDKLLLVSKNAFFYMVMKSGSHYMIHLPTEDQEGPCQMSLSCQ